MSGRLDTGILVVQGSNEHDRIAELVLLVVDGALQEHLRLTRLQGVEDEAGPVLGDHTGGDGAVYEVEHLRCTGVRVGSVHTARAEQTDGHSKA